MEKQELREMEDNTKNNIDLHHYHDHTVKTNGDGDRFWYNKAGERHRDGDLPAIIHSDGTQFWYKNGKLHRDGDKPAVVPGNGGEPGDGVRSWYKNGKLHRDGAPAIITDLGGEVWYQHGKRHRLDGPAVTYDNGSTEHWINGIEQRDPSEFE
jgi:hypothetical protein